MNKSMIFKIMIAAVVGVVVTAGAPMAPRAPLGPTPAMASHYGEYDVAKHDKAPPSNVMNLPCTTIWHSQNFAIGVACYQESGDYWWVKDSLADGYSVTVQWDNIYDHYLYRTGECRNRGGAGTWGYCNKDYREYSGLSFRACRYHTTTCSAFREANA